MRIRFCTTSIIVLLGLSCVTAFGDHIQRTSLMPIDEMESYGSVLTVSPQEIDLGTLGPGEESKGTVYLQNSGPGTTEWFAEGPDGWILSENQHLSGQTSETSEPFSIRLAYLKETGTLKDRGCALILRLETGGHETVLRHEVPLGDLREEIRFLYDRGTISVFFHVKLLELSSTPLLDLEPLRMDFGTTSPGKQITKRILLKNRGRESLKWTAGVAGGRGMPPTAPPSAGAYVSLKTEVSQTGPYPVGGPFPEGIELSGDWSSDGGYPSGQGEQNILRYRFTGTGIGLYFWKSPDGGPFNVFLDETFVSRVDGFSERRERGEALIFEGQPEGSRLLTIINGAGRLTLEGLRVFGKTVRKGPRGWISIFPDSGFTTRETDYINVALNTGQLAPGIYTDHVFFQTNGGAADVEVFLTVTTETTSKFLDVHRYVAGSDYLYTTKPQFEDPRLQLKRYRYDGIAFRLFAPGTPGTTEFFRWFNPSKGDHYYAYDPKGGKALPGYRLEGAIGNIATSRLSGAKELYRWFNSENGRHFYTTDPAGEGITKKGYRFDGIAGFVR